MRKKKFKDHFNPYKRGGHNRTSTGIKNYTCKYCKYSGTRQMVRKHLREEHGIRGLEKDALGQRQESQLTESTMVKDFDE